jgi:hypothetical protein
MTVPMNEAFDHTSYYPMTLLPIALQIRNLFNAHDKCKNANGT